MWELKSPEAMKALASRLAALISPVDFIALYGELGAGKTTFAQGLLPALGVAEAVTSPTYGLVHSYAAGGRKVNHCDFYRLSPGDEEETGYPRDVRREHRRRRVARGHSRRAASKPA